MRNFRPSSIDIHEPPPVRYFCQKRAWVFVKPMVKIVENEIGDERDEQHIRPDAGCIYDNRVKK